MTIAQPLQDVHISAESTKAAEAPVEKPRLTLVPTTDPATDILQVLKVYQTQKRECWLCEKIAGALQGGKDTSDDEKWHFTTCVLSWENLVSPSR